MADAKSKSMQNEALFWWKAERCARLAKNAITPHERTIYAVREKDWRKLAVLLEVAEAAKRPRFDKSGFNRRLPFLRTACERYARGLRLIFGRVDKFCKTHAAFRVDVSGGG